jgi:hypothetical protein
MCLAVVFLPLIEKELGEFMHYWNTHCIRQSNGNCIGGIPDDLHDMPQHDGKYNIVIVMYYHYPLCPIILLLYNPMYDCACVIQSQVNLLENLHKLISIFNLS